MDAKRLADVIVNGAKDRYTAEAYPERMLGLLRVLDEIREHMPPEFGETAYLDRLVETMFATGLTPEQQANW